MIARLIHLSILISAGAVLAQAPKPAPAKKQPPVPPPLPPTAYALEDAFPGLKFEQPVAIVPVPGDKSRLVIVERTGRLQTLTNLASDAPAKQVFLDFTKPRDGDLTVEGECGLLGFAFHPDYANNGQFFVYYSLRIQGQLYQRVSRFTEASSGSEQPLITQEDPASNHNGGDLQFGPDGYLYIAVGDGGAGNDKFDNSHFINKGFHAAILRIDVDKKPGSLPPNPHPAIALEAEEARYAVPKDNPFHGATAHHGQAIDPKTVRTEIYATGLRNPWRMSFDPPTGRLFAGDVGQNLYEEVDIIVKGGDYGWSYREGLHPFPLGPGGGQEPANFKPIDPMFEYPRTMGLSITGGVVYRGSKFPDLAETYIFADFAFGRVISLRERERNPQWKPEILANEAGITGIGIDPRDGEVLFANMALGVIKRLKKL